MDELPLILRGGAVWAGPGRFFAPGALVLGNLKTQNAKLKTEDGGTRVLFVGGLEEARRKFSGEGGAREDDWGHCLLMPGMVNAHCHLELSYLRGELGGARPGELPGECFVRWVKAMWGRRPTVEELGSQVKAAVKDGLKESLRFGVTVIGDITRHVEWSRKEAGRGPVRVISFGEVLGIGTQRIMAKGWMGLIAEQAEMASLGFLKFGVSPHAPYTVEGPILEEVMRVARMRAVPVAMHMAELREEKEFLQSLGGPLRELWNVRKPAEEVLDEKIPRFDRGPVAWAKHWGLLEKRDHRNVKSKGARVENYDHWVSQLSASVLQLEARLKVLKSRLSNLNTTEEPLRALQLETERSKATVQLENFRARLAEAGGSQEIPILLAHCNYLSDEDLRIIAESSASVVMCPRTRAFFGHTAKHRFRELMEMGVNVCLGTDSLASNPDLSVLREAREIWGMEGAGGMTAEEVMGMVTWRGARALGIDGGELVEGGRGDLVAMRMGDASSLESVLGSVIRDGEAPEGVWVGGRRD